MRRLTGEDAGLWRRAMRDVAPLPGRERPETDRRHPAGNAAGTAAVQPERSAAAAPAQPPKAELPPLDRFAGVDRATSTAAAAAGGMSRGLVPVYARMAPIKPTWKPAKTPARITKRCLCERARAVAIGGFLQVGRG